MSAVTYTPEVWAVIRDGQRIGGIYDHSELGGGFLACPAGERNKTFDTFDAALTYITEADDRKAVEAA